MLRVTTIHGGTPAGGGGGSAARGVAAYLTEYYAGAGEEPGVWVGDPASRLALEGAVQREDLVAVLEGRDPRDGTRLGRGFTDRVLADGRVVRPVIGFDATFSAPKSVSVMWALTQDPGWTAAHDTAVSAVIDHLQAHAATTRVRTKTGRDYPDTQGLIVATFRQHTSRADDPQVHTHTFISSKVQTADGGWWALDARYLKRYQRALGGLYQSVLRAELTARYGVSWGPVVQGQAEIAAVPGVLVEAFSKRTGQVDALLPGKIAEFTVRNGRAPTGYEHAALVRQAALDSRAAKTGLGVGDLTRDWAAQAVALGWDRDRLARTVVPAGQIRDALARAGGLGVLGATRGWVDELGVAGGVFDQVTAMVTRASTWHRGDVLRAITDLAVPPVGVGGDRWAHLLEETADRFLVGRCLSLDPPPAGRVRGSDGRGVRLDPMIGAYTTAGILAQEEHLVTWTLDHTTTMPTLSGSTPRVLESGTRLDPDQHTAARVVAGQDRLVFIIGPAGTGKTSTLAAAVVDLEAQGRRVVGVAPSNQAAHILAMETGMPADSVAKLLFEHARPEGPPVGWRYPAGTTVVVDEAGMVNTGDLAQLVGLVDRYGWRLVLVGDPYQLAAVGRGGMFTELARHANPVELTRVRRFTQEWEGPASLALRHGDLGVVGTYEHHGRVTAGTFDEHVEHATRVWFAETRVGRTVAITAATNEEVDRINTRLQAVRLTNGDLDPAMVVEGGGGDRLHPGDVVATRRNERALTTDRGVIVKNRAQWTVTRTHPTTGAVTLTGRDGTITLPADYTAQHVRLAYAATVYGTQGATVDTSITFVSGATDHRNLYVGATRGRHTNQLYVMADTIEDARDSLEQAIARDRVDQPAVTVRRELLGQQGPRLTVERGDRGGVSPVPAAGDERHGDTTALDATDPFHGLETVREALQRLQAERDERQAPRDRYRALQRDVNQHRADRERLDRSRSPYEHGPLDEVERVLSNARYEVNVLTARLQTASWRDRRHVRHQLDHATERLDTAQTARDQRYQTETARLDTLISHAQDRLEQATGPEPVGPRDQELDTQVRWLHWETSVGNQDRPTLGALQQRRDQLAGVTAAGRLTRGETRVADAIDGELGARDGQYQEALAAQQERETLARQRSIRRDNGPELGL